MPYFPLFIDLKDRPCLIVGGGRVACRKVEKLRPYGPNITLIAPEFCPELEAMTDVVCLRRAFENDDIRGMTLVIAATDDATLNCRVSQLCQAENIPVNVVDDRENCTFLFPCLVQEGELSVGISTGGASPTAAIWLKEQIGALLPTDFDAILVWLEGLRPRFKEEIPEESRRAALFSAAFRACLEKGGSLTEQELETLMEVTP